MRIAHIADVHIRGLSRHDEIRTVFSALVEDIKARDVEHLFIGGDIFHTKTTGITPEYIDLMTWWLTTLASVSFVHMTLGNHDGNLTNMSRQDAVTPIANALNNPRIKIYKSSGVYQFAPGFNWCVFSLFDSDWSKVKPVQGDINIACYHGPVWGAVTETDWEVKEGLKIDDFKDYDFCFLGDIHKMQFLDMRPVEIEIDEEDLHKYPGARVLGEVQ